MPKNFDFKTPKDKFLKLFPEKKKDIESIFRQNPFYTNIRFYLPVRKKSLHKMFSDLPFTVKKANSYGYQSYKINTVKENLYKISHEPELRGIVETLLSDQEKDHYIFLVKGTYNGFLTIRGDMLIDLKFTTHENDGKFQNFEIKSYITFKNDILLETARRLFLFRKLGEKIDNFIDFNIKKTVKIGKNTAIKIDRELKILPQ